MTDTVRLLYVLEGDGHAPPPETLEDTDDDLVVEAAHTVSDGLDRLTAATFDCVLSTCELPDEDGVTFLRHIRDFDQDLPFVLYAESGSERVASEAISAGVTDYVQHDPAADQSTLVADRIRAAVTSRTRGSEAKVRELTEATEDVLWLISADWEEVLFVNSAYADIWGQSESQLRTDPTAFLDAVHPDDRQRAEAAVERLTDGESVEIELRVNPGEDFQRRVLIQAEPVFGRDGSVARIAGASRDVTEQRARQRRLEEETRMVDSIFDALPDVIYSFDTQGYLRRWNDQLEAETGYSSSEIEEMYVTDFVPAEEVEQVATSFQTVIEERRSVTVESAFETKSGERVPFEFTGAPLEDADGDLRGVTGVGRNIADRKQRQRRFEAVFDNTYQFTGLMSPDGTLLEVNETAIAFAGVNREDLLGEKIWNAYWFQSNETAYEAARRSVETANEGDLFREQITVQGSDREAVIDFSVRPVVNEDDTVELLVPEGRDITRLSERERQLRVTNRFLRHNIRNKLTTIKGHGSLVGEADDDRLQSFGERIVEAATELNATAETARAINELIAHNPTPEVVDLAEHLDDAVETARENHPHADILVDRAESLAVTSLPSLYEALAELLELVLTNASDDQPTVRVAATQGETVTVTIGPVDDALPPAEREVLTGDIDINQVRHAQGLGVWYVYWHVWYSGGDVTVTEDNDRIELALPSA